MRKQVGNTDIISTFKAGSFRLKLFAVPLGLAWKHCGITSDFLGDFYSARAVRGSVDANEIRHNVCYLVNEILENAVKFRTSGDIVIETSLENGTFRLCIANTISKEGALRFQDVLSGLQGRDPSELLIERIERNAADPNSTGSGLGLLTLMSDYGVQLGWDFQAPSDQEGTVQLATYAVLPLP